MRQNTYLKELFESMDVGVLVADDSAHYVDLNRAACELFGRSRSDIVGHHLSEFIPGAKAAEVDVQWKAFLRDGIQSGVFAIQLPDGSIRQFDFQARANFINGLHCSFVSLPGRPANSDEILTICAWTKRILYGTEWLTIEEYLRRVHGARVTHGISPDAFAIFREQQKDNSDAEDGAPSRD